MGSFPLNLRSGSLGSMPSDLLQEGYRRLGMLALVYAGVYTIAAFLIPYPEVETGRFFAGRVIDIVGMFFIASSVAIYLVLRSGRLKGNALCWLGFGFCFYGAIGIEVGVLTWNGDPDLITMGLSWTPVWIVSFPLLAPAPPWLTFWSSLLAATARPLMFAILWLEGIPMPDPATMVPLIIPAYLCVGIAVLSSRVVYGWGRNIQEARRLGSYQLSKKLGAGGMGEVWVAEHAMLARPAAIKLVRPDLTSDPHILERFEREVQSTARLRSPHTIAVYDYGVTPDATFYYVMELLDGIDLDKVVRQNGALPVPRVIHILRQACHSLAEAHEAGIIHRDIKPANIFLCRYGREVDFVKVLDFGLVKQQGMQSDDLALTKANAFTGTPTYASPEMARGESSKVDGRSDIYALGCVAFWLLSGRHVFEAATPLEMLMKHVGDTPDPVSLHAEQEIPPELDALLLDCMQKERDARIGSAEELDSRLASIQESYPWSVAGARRWWAAQSPHPALGGAAVAGEEDHQGLVISKWREASTVSTVDSKNLSD